MESMGTDMDVSQSDGSGAQFDEAVAVRFESANSSDSDEESSRPELRLDTGGHAQYVDGDEDVPTDSDALESSDDV